MIEINNLTESKIDFDVIKKIVEKVLTGEGFSETAELSIAFVGSGRMRKLNKTYRKKNRVTDVLSFSEKTIPLGKLKIGEIEKIQGFGEMVICPKQIQKNAKEFNTSFGGELKKVVIHGVLHLLGYEHEQEENEAKKMHKKEIQYLNS